MTTILPNKFGPKSQSATKHCIGEQQVYASPDNFTPTLFVMLETFRRSGDVLLRDEKMFHRASNAGVKFFPARVKCVPNFTLFCCKTELMRNLAGFFLVILKSFYLVNF